MSTAGNEELVEFLLRETGEHLHVVLRYDADDWEQLYLSETAEDLLDRTAADVDEVLDLFRQEGGRNERLQSTFDLGWYYCSLHLFEAIVVIHFFQFDDRGIIFGYDPAAATHLTGFVSLVLPYIRAAGLEDLDESPDWEEP